MMELLLSSLQIIIKILYFYQRTFIGIYFENYHMFETILTLKTIFTTNASYNNKNFAKIG